jgi:hypothetical protein
MREPFAMDDLYDVRNVVFAISISPIEDYANDLQAAGFRDVATTDLTSDWAAFVADRLAKWRPEHTDYARVHGEEAYAAQEKFSSVIARLYDGGSLGGVRLIARAP